MSADRWITFGLAIIPVAAAQAWEIMLPSYELRDWVWIAAFCASASMILYGLAYNKVWSWIGKPMKDEKPPSATPLVGGISIGDGSSIGGDVGHKFINQAPKPELKWGNRIVTPISGGYRIECLLDIVTANPIGEVKFMAIARNAHDLEVLPHRTGVSMTGHSGVRDGFCFTSIYNAFGRYTVRFISDDPDGRVEYSHS